MNTSSLTLTLALVHATYMVLAGSIQAWPVKRFHAAVEMTLVVG